MTALAPLLPAAVLGTARRTFEPADAPLGFGPLEGAGASAAELLLAAAARAAVADRVALPAGAGVLDPGPGTETRPAPASPAYPGALLQALGGQRWAAVAESLADLARRDRRLPVGVLHHVLEAAVGRRELRPLLAPVLGERGRWLAATNPRWRFDELHAPDPADTDVWRFGTRGERVAWLAAVRAAEPDRARALLTADLAGEDAATRAQLLAVLRMGLTAADEDLLEVCLDDRARDVRALARELLASLPESAYVARMTRRLHARVLLGRGRWLVDLSDLGPADERDGLVVPAAERPPGATAVRALVAGVPLATWRELDVAPTDLIGLRDGAVELGPMPGLRDAAIREGDAAVAEAVLRDARWPADPELVRCLAADRLDLALARRVQALGPVQALPELTVRGFGPETAGVLLAWVSDNRSAGQRAAVLAALGSHGPRGDPAAHAGDDLAHDLRRCSAGLLGADRNRALDAAMTLNLRRALAAEAEG